MHNHIDLKKHIRSIPDFPKPGILFYDISTLLAHAKAWHATIERMADALRPYKPDVLAGVESRGFLLAAPLALALGTGFVMIPMHSSTAPTRSRYNRMRSPRVHAWCWSTTCWPPAAPWRPR